MGETFEDYKNDMKNALMTQKVISEEISSKVTIPEADKKKYYDEHKNDFVRDERVFSAADPGFHGRENARTGGRGGEEGQGSGGTRPQGREVRRVWPWPIPTIWKPLKMVENCPDSSVTS